ncbi:MAG: hypothetical protein COU40_01090 [Candidatus Moranbacteria bacterium CG10_big_fil_rev_8_21_14_0_10_35_21]|nr:MAG: hypothetical protein COU40_01090 [Candidatus Moranbacteria bacterium CG10_big_fil_rev_8_21_14_0_10_35_21]PJA88541.1 MAG: hypothetical protein CO139_02570 [Candidatus Moranbacteria bacterium CG_4_9_14_3_um_filter_36_9]
MNGIQTWGEAISMSLRGLWERFIDFLPTLIGALLVFIIGWLIAVALGKIAEKVLKSIKIDQAVEKIGLNSKMSDMGIGSGVSEFFGDLVKWFLVLVFLMAATDILNLNQVTNYLNSIVLYIPNVVVAVIVLAIAFLVGNFVFGIVKGSTRAAGVMSATLLATISKWAIVIFGILAALIQLGIASALVSTIFIGIVAMLALAGGLAFGLGGKEEAQSILRKLREEITERK